MDRQTLTNTKAWGKRDYPCVNVFQGIPDNSTVSPGSKITLEFNRASTSHCDDTLAKYPGSDYSLWLYNNPVRNLDMIHFDQEIKITDGIPEKDGTVTFTIPENLPAVKDDSVWYLRLSTSLSTAPQVSGFRAFGRVTWTDTSRCRPCSTLLGLSPFGKCARGVEKELSFYTCNGHVL